jgi:hypothetical protein
VFVARALSFPGNRVFRSAIDINISLQQYIAARRHIPQTKMSHRTNYSFNTQSLEGDICGDYSLLRKLDDTLGEYTKLMDYCMSSFAKNPTEEVLDTVQFDSVIVHNDSLVGCECIRPCIVDCRCQS